MSTKTCNTCCVEKPITAFSPRRNACKGCRNSKDRDLYLRNKKQKQSQKPSIVMKQCTNCNTNKLEDKFLGNLPVCEECNIKILNQYESFKGHESVHEYNECEYLYLITSPLYETVNRFKIGIHTGTLSKLKSRYKTYLIDVDVVRFIKCRNYALHESNIHKLLHEHRVSNTEWFELPRDKILSIFDNYVSQNIPQIESYRINHKISIKEKEFITSMINMISYIDSPSYNKSKLDVEFSRAIELFDEMQSYPNTIKHGSIDGEPSTSDDSEFSSF